MRHQVHQEDYNRGNTNEANCQTINTQQEEGAGDLSGGLWKNVVAVESQATLHVTVQLQSQKDQHLSHL